MMSECDVGINEIVRSSGCDFTNSISSVFGRKRHRKPRRLIRPPHPNSSIALSKPSSPCYRTTNWSSYNEALQKRGSLLVWFDRDMAWFADRCGKRGRPETSSEAAIQLCQSVKVLFGPPLRQTSGMVAIGTATIVCDA